MVLIGSLILTACNTSGQDTSSNPELLRLNIVSPSVGYKDETYSFKLEVSGGVAPLQYRVAGGELPPGLKLDPNGNIVGQPTKSGSYTFVLRVSDARLSSDSKSVSMSVQDQPIPVLSLDFPATEIREETRIPVRIAGARKVGATRLKWNIPDNVEVLSVQGASARPLMLWQAKEGSLTLDMGFQNPPDKDGVVAFLRLKPLKPVQLTGPFGYEARSNDGKVLAKQALPEPEPKPVPAPEPEKVLPTPPVVKESPTPDPKTQSQEDPNLSEDPENTAPDDEETPTTLDPKVPPPETPKKVEPQPDVPKEAPKP